MCVVTSLFLLTLSAKLAPKSAPSYVDVRASSHHCWVAANGPLTAVIQNTQAFLYRLRRRRNGGRYRGNCHSPRLFEVEAPPYWLAPSLLLLEMIFFKPSTQINLDRLLRARTLTGLHLIPSDMRKIHLRDPVFQYFVLPRNLCSLVRITDNQSI